MTLAYFDSSALVKLVVDEEGSDAVTRLWDGAAVVLSSRVAHPEVSAALAAAYRSERLALRAYGRANQDWRQFRAALRIVELSPRVEAYAADLTYVHALSGFDAIHLASALGLEDAPVVLATWDRRLLTAAQAEGLVTLPATPP